VARQHRKALERFAFDSVLLPFSYVLMRNDGYRADFEELMDVCRARGVAVQTIKSIVRAPWGERMQRRNTWYEPLEDQEDIDLAIGWVLGERDVFINTVGDVDVLPKVLEAATRWDGKRPAEKQMEQLAGKCEMEPLFVE
jgi:hypothetical protein